MGKEVFDSPHHHEEDPYDDHDDHEDDDEGFDNQGDKWGNEKDGDKNCAQMPSKGGTLIIQKFLK